MFVDISYTIQIGHDEIPARIRLVYNKDEEGYNVLKMTDEVLEDLLDVIRATGAEVKKTR